MLSVPPFPTLSSSSFHPCLPVYPAGPPPPPPPTSSSSPPRSHRDNCISWTESHKNSRRAVAPLTRPILVSFRLFPLRNALSYGTKEGRARSHCGRASTIRCRCLRDAHISSVHGLPSGPRAISSRTIISIFESSRALPSSCYLPPHLPPYPLHGSCHPLVPTHLIALTR